MVIGFLWRWLGGSDSPPNPPPNNNFGEGGNGIPAKRIPILWDGETYTDVSQSYVDKGIAEGWIVPTFDRYWVVRNNQQTLAVVYVLCAPR